jgi:hypothetical protein
MIGGSTSRPSTKPATKPQANPHQRPQQHAAQKANNNSGQAAHDNSNYNHGRRFLLPARRSTLQPEKIS